MGIEKSIVWKDKKRTLFGLPLSFTTYTLTDEKLYIDRGVLSKTQEEVRLYRILDFTLKRSLGQRIFGVGTIHICSADKNTPEFDIVNIKDSEEVKEQMSELVEAQRQKKNISGREFMQAEDDMDFL